MTPSGLGTAGAIRIVAEREVRERTRTKAFRWGTALMAVLAAGLALAPRVLPDAEDPEWDVAVVGTVPDGLEAAVEAIMAVEAGTLTLEAFDGDLEGALEAGEFDAALVDGRELVSQGEPSERLQTLLSAAVAQAGLAVELGERGIAQDEVAELLAGGPLEVRTLGSDDRAAREGVAFLGSLVLFIAIVTYGGWVLYSVLEEKANRIVELVVAAVTPSQLLAGKVIGVGLVAIAQLVLIVAVGAVAATVAGTVPDLPDFVPGSIAWALVWFVLGFAFYAVGYAAAGSLTARQEDAQSAATPLITTVMIAYFVSVFLVGPNPGSLATRVLTYAPPLTPLVVPARVASGEISGLEIALAILVMLAATWAMTRVAAAIYRSALLHSGGRIKALAALRRARG